MTPCHDPAERDRDVPLDKGDKKARNDLVVKLFSPPFEGGVVPIYRDGGG